MFLLHFFVHKYYTLFTILCQVICFVSFLLKNRYRQENPLVARIASRGFRRLHSVALLLAEHHAGDPQASNGLGEFRRVSGILLHALLLEAQHAALNTAAGANALLCNNPRSRLNPGHGNHHTGFGVIALALSGSHQAELAELLVNTTHFTTHPILGRVVVIVVHQLLPLVLVLGPVNNVDGAMEVRATTIINFATMGTEFRAKLVVFSFDLVDRPLFLQHVPPNLATTLHVTTFLSSYVLVVTTSWLIARCPPLIFQYSFIIPLFVHYVNLGLRKHSSFSLTNIRINFTSDTFRFAFVESASGPTKIYSLKRRKPSNQC